MNGIKKAALFLSGLDYNEADQLLSRLDVESARLVRREIMSLKQHRVSVEESQQLDEEFLHAVGWQPSRAMREHQFAASKPATYSPLRHSVAQHNTMKYTAEAFVPPVCFFEFMKDLSDHDVVSAIIDEHPQTIAVVLAHLPRSQMMSVLAALPLELQREIKRRLDAYEMPDEQFVQEIESALKTRCRSRQRSVRYSTELESFDDVETLNDAEIATLFRSVSLTTAMLSLIGADPALIVRITRHFSPTEEHEMRRQLKTFSSIDVEDIEQARQNIMQQYNATH